MNSNTRRIDNKLTDIRNAYAGVEITYSEFEELVRFLASRTRLKLSAGDKAALTNIMQFIR